MSAVKKVTPASGKRDVPLKKSSKWYPSQEDAAPKKVRKSIRPSTLRPSLKPGTVLIILAGRFRGKRVVYLKPLSNGVILVTGPFRINGVPLRRVNARYVIATSTQVDIKGLKLDKFTDKYFSREADVKKTKEQKLFKGDKATKKVLPTARKHDQKEVDTVLLKTINKVPQLSAYIGSTFALSKGDRPHLMQF